MKMPRIVHALRVGSHALVKTRNVGETWKECVTEDTTAFTCSQAALHLSRMDHSLSPSTWNPGIPAPPFPVLPKGEKSSQSTLASVFSWSSLFPHKTYMCLFPGKFNYWLNFKSIQHNFYTQTVCVYVCTFSSYLLVLACVLEIRSQYCISFPGTTLLVLS